MLPIKYVGVPLIDSRILSKRCACLVDRILSKLESWNTKFFAYAGRLQLIKAAILSIQNYWSVIFPIPKGVLKDIDSKCRAFLWSRKLQS